MRGLGLAFLILTAIVTNTDRLLGEEVSLAQVSVRFSTDYHPNLGRVSLNTIPHSENKFRLVWDGNDCWLNELGLPEICTKMMPSMWTVELRKIKTKHLDRGQVCDVISIEGGSIRGKFQISHVDETYRLIFTPREGKVEAFPLNVSTNIYTPAPPAPSSNYNDDNDNP